MFISMKEIWRNLDGPPNFINCNNPIFINKASSFQLDCCGLDGSEDFERTDWWNITIRENMAVPVACCKDISAAVEVKIKGGNPDCAVSPTDRDSNYKQVKAIFMDTLDRLFKRFQLQTGKGYLYGYTRQII